MIKEKFSLTENELIFSGLIVIIILMALYVWTLFIQNKTLVTKVNKIEQHNKNLLETLDLKEFPEGDDNSYW